MSRRLAAAGWVFVVLATGCDRGTGTLSGQVTYKGQPVTSGMVTVVDADGVPHGASIQPDGKYRVTDVPAGPVRVAVTSPDPRIAAAEARGEGATPPPATAAWRPIPERYADAATSGLTFTVKRGDNVFPIELTDGP